MPYDPNNIFAKILRGELPCTKVYEDDDVLAFDNIYPQRKVHVMIISKGAYKDISQLADDAEDNEILALMRAVPKVAAAKGIRESGYRVITNCGPHSGQEIPHIHLHLLGGEPLGALVA